MRPDLLFVHGAVLWWQERVAVLAASAGTGKSTLAFAALHHGLEYFSDELAPIDVHRLTVHPYPRSIYLKTPPPHPYVLPRGAIDHGGSFHLPTQAPASAHRDCEAPLAAMIFLRRDGGVGNGFRQISAASGATYLVANTLNLLAHPAAGLEPASLVSLAVPCFELDTSDLAAASGAVRDVLSR